MTTEQQREAPVAEEQRYRVHRGALKWFVVDDSQAAGRAVATCDYEAHANLIASALNAEPVLRAALARWHKAWEADPDRYGRVAEWNDACDQLHELAAALEAGGRPKEGVTK